MGGITSLSFEQGSRLKIIDDYTFKNSNLTGNLVLPQTIEYIGNGAFLGNNLTSVTFPSSARYFTNCIDPWNNNCDTFDASVTINHNY